MIVKNYDVFCDLCNKLLATYLEYKPTPTKLRQDGMKIVFNNGKIHIFCADCFKVIHK